MALFQCPKCLKSISDSTVQCVFCGNITHNTEQYGKLIVYGYTDMYAINPTIAIKNNERTVAQFGWGDVCAVTIENDCELKFTSALRSTKFKASKNKIERLLVEINPHFGTITAIPFAEEGCNLMLQTAFDKFEKKSTVISNNTCIINDSYTYGTYLKFRNIITPDIDHLVIDAFYIGHDWIFLRQGTMIININNTENITLQAYESYSDSVNLNNQHIKELEYVDLECVTEGVRCIESVFYNISLDLLNKICTAKSVEIKLKGKNSSIIANNCDLIECAQVFYNSYYDGTKYIKSVATYYKRQIRSDTAKKSLAMKIILIIVAIIIIFIFKCS